MRATTAIATFRRHGGRVVDARSDSEQGHARREEGKDAVGGRGKPGGAAGDAEQ